MNHMDELGMNEVLRVCVPLCDRILTDEVSGEYVLPDYLPEIRRLLWVEQTVLPPAKYVGNGNAELNGTMDYRVLYVGGDGGLYSASFSTEYSMTAPLERSEAVDLNEGVTVLALPSCEGVTTRVGGPRRLSIRTRLRMHVRVFGTMVCELRSSGEVDPASIRRLGMEARTMRVTSGLSDVISLEEELVGVGEDARVIGADARVFLSEVHSRDGLAEGRGEVLLELTVGREDGSVERVSRRAPLEGEVELDGLTAEGSCCMSGTVSDLSVTVEEGRILCELGILFEARGMVNRPLHYTADLYSTCCECDCEYESITLPVALKCENGNVSQSERIPLEGLNIPEGAQIEDVCCTVIPEGGEQVGERYVLGGQCRYLLLCRREGEYSVSEVTLPFRYETDCAGGTSVSAAATAQMISCRARLEGDKLSLDAELSVVADLLGKEEIRTVKTARFGAPVDRCDNRIVVCYPVAGDTPWSVAKRYHVSPERLSEQGSFYLI